MNQRKLNLFPNLQFIYELHLAQMEAEKLTPGAVLNADFRSFSANGEAHSEVVKKRSAYIGTVQAQQKEIEALRAELKEQRALIQEVNDKVELNRPAPQTALNNQ
jgi:hypothetical protein